MARKPVKANKVWAYLVKNKTATPAEVSKATGVSYAYVYKLMQRIGTPKEVFKAEAREEAKSPVKKSQSSGNVSQRSSEVTRANILDTAKAYVTKDRASDHGDMENNFSTIAKYWTVHLDHEVKATDVAVMMNLLKVARIKSNPWHPDNWVDGAGYMACGGELAGRET
tara:strand:+ start:1951 stop:2454 length:504 start_codon:yes stop_codon:yes gene_type:complete